MPDLTEYPFSPKRINIDGHSLAYLDEGEGSPVIMLHGNPTWSYFYRRFVTLLSSRYRVIVPDHMGCGNSDKPQDYQYILQTHITNVQKLLAELAIDTFSLMVHDWGGAIGMGVAVSKPERVKSILVMNSAAFRSQRIPFRISICRVPLLGDILVRGMNGFARGALSMAVSRKMDAAVARSYISPYDSWANRVALLRFVQDIPLDPGDRSWETLVRIEESLDLLKHVPMIILWGGQDFCFTRHFYEEWLQRFPNAEPHFFSQAGHYLPEDAFAEIAPLVKTFLERNYSHELQHC